jgi:uncharacterized repeat protein (TIGR01451 family)
VKKINIILCFCLVLLGVTPLAPVSAAADSTPASLVDLVVEFPKVVGTEGASFVFSLYIRNYDTVPRAYNLAVSGPDKWTFALSPQEDSSKQISTVQVAGNGGYQYIDLTAAPPSQEPAGPGEYPITMSATSSATGSSTQTSVEMVAVVRPTYILYIEPVNGATNTNAAIGRGGVFSINIRNTGTSPITGISFSSDLPKGWEVTVSPDGISSLNAQDSQLVDLTITPPSGSAPGDRYVTFHATGQETTAILVIRVNAKSPSIWGWVTLAAVVLLAAAIVYWRVFRRRQAKQT